MCRSIAAWAEEVGKPKLSAEADDIQPIIDSIQVSLLPLVLLLFPLFFFLFLCFCFASFPASSSLRVRMFNRYGLHFWWCTKDTVQLSKADKLHQETGI